MIRQIRLLVLIPKKLWNGQRDQKVWPRKESSVYLLCPFLAHPQRRCVPLGIGRSVENHGTTEQGSSLAFCRVCHSFTQTHHSQVQQKTCLLGEQRTRAPSILTLSWRILDETPRWKVVAELWKTWGFLASRGEEFNPWPETRLDYSKFLCNKVLLKYKRDRESFWHRHQKGAERVTPC